MFICDIFCNLSHSRSSKSNLSILDGSGTNPAAINISMSFIYNLYDYRGNGLCSGYSRHIITAVADVLYPWPLNVTDSNMITQIRDFFNSGLKPYKGIFDLQTAVTTFLNDPQYCSFDSRINAPAWAIIYAFSDTINGFNNFYNAVTKLHEVGFEVLLVAGNLKVYKMAQYMQVLPQENIVSASNVTGVDVAEYLLSRFNATYNVPIVNQTGLNGTILSPGYPNYYIPLTLVDYYIAAPTSYYQIFLVVNDFETYNCDDKLLIFKKEMMDDDDWLYT
ncbi:hypothetical protein WR25_12578 isoform D [Diploscapter pachys]|uniref:VWFA domain-containing protein n=1 Tax=Diploscapter pachys TaxID=2018661 RepID=A0A2A2L7R9_9BILA|nr:hypothetical protein WR25_12578 isoform D [Diploscapter pachys]